jgi:predicted outer membrane repeat protein
LIEKELTISAGSTAQVTIDAQMLSRIFNITAGPVTFNYLTLLNGFLINENGGAIKIIDTDLFLNYVNVADCESLKGAGVYSFGANLQVLGGQYSGNKSIDEGGGFWKNQGMLTLQDVNIQNNSTQLNGGGIYMREGTSRIINCTISNNRSLDIQFSNNGAGIYNDNGNLFVMESTLSNNISTESGGAIFSINGTVEISNSFITNNRARDAGAGLSLHSNQNVSLTNVQLNNNIGGISGRNNGGAIYALGSNSITINGGTIKDNISARNGGGIYNNQGVVEINGTLIQGNISNEGGIDSGGGGIYCLGESGQFIINPGTQFLNNIVESAFAGTDDGGAILMEEGSTLIINSTVKNPVTFEGNVARGSGGAIAYRSSQSLNLNNIIFTENTAFYGGALHIVGNGNINILESFFNSNGKGDQICEEGGGISINDGTLNIDRTIFSNNSGGEKGGAIYNNGGTVNINNAEIKSNFSLDNLGAGGGLYNDNGGSLSITNSMVSDNGAGSFGGGIVNNSLAQQGSLTLTNVVLKNNYTSNGEIGIGGGLYIMGNGNTAITSCEISANHSGNKGGALWNDAASIQIISSTFSGNYTTTHLLDQSADGNAGAIYNNAGSIYIDASTIVLNKAYGAGGAFYNASPAATTTLKNSIVALNTAEEGNNLAGESGFVSADYNLIGEDSLSVFPAMSNDLEGTFESPLDPMIDSLANNGGFTQTHAFLDGSPAYNAGNPIDNFPDQRGEAVFGGRRDIGAFEAQTNLGIESTIATSDKSLLYPNPSTSGFVQLNIPDSETSVSISVIEMGSGKIVLSQVGKSGLNIMQTDGLNSGMYLVRLISDRNVESLKMLVAN